MIYSPTGRVLFARVSRTGGTSIVHCLQQALPDATQLSGLDQHDFLAAARPLLGRQFDEAFKFAFVRNPWDRFVSWYALIARSTRPDLRETAALADPESAHWKEFDAFLESWAAEEVTIDGVTRRKLSQWWQLADAEGRLLTGDIGRFESYATEVSRLFEKMAITAPPLPRINRSNHLHYSVYYSDFGRELVQDVFAEDLEHFDYRFQEEEESPLPD